MNFYQHHIGDYSKDTAHLSMLEDAAYRRMLDVYYATERPLPAKPDAIHRLIRARSAPERKAVEVVLQEFFVDSPEGWRNKRADEELAKAHAKSEKARGSAALRWHSDGNANAMRTHSEGNAPNNQEPVTKNQGNNVTPLSTAKPPTDPIPYEAIVSSYHAAMTNLAKVRELTPKRKTLIRAAWQSSPHRRSPEFWKAYFEECAADEFLSGVGPYRPPHDNWRPTFDYLLRSETVTKVYEKAMDRLDREAVA